MSAVIEIECWCDETGVVNTEAAIETETEQFFIPISAIVLPPDQFKAWEEEGGQLPCNIASVDQPPRRMVRSKAPTVATLRRQLAQKREAAAMGKDDGGSHPHKAADLQDPVPEPNVPSTEIDWFVDATRHVSSFLSFPFAPISPLPYAPYLLLFEERRDLVPIPLLRDTRRRESAGVGVGRWGRILEALNSTQD